MALDILNSVPRPTIDRPFAIELWPIFDKVFTSVVGYPTADFEFVKGSTPMSTLETTVTALISYYVIMFGGREIMRNCSALKLNGLFKLHNLFLTTASAILLALFIEQLLPTLWNHGVFYTICNREGGWTKPLLVLYFVCLSTPATFGVYFSRADEH